MTRLALAIFTLLVLAACGRLSVRTDFIPRGCEIFDDPIVHANCRLSVKP